MLRTRTVKEILESIDFGLSPSIRLSESDYVDPEINEALQFGLIQIVGYKYALTKEGLMFLRSGVSYDDYLREHLLPKHSTTVVPTHPQITNSQTGITGAVKKAYRFFIMILINVSSV